MPVPIKSPYTSGDLVQITSGSVRISGGEIDIATIQAGSLSITGGSIAISTIQSGSVSIKTGSLTITNIQTGQVSLAGGSVNISTIQSGSVNITGEVNIANISTGNVDVDWHNMIQSTEHIQNNDFENWTAGSPDNWTSSNVEQDTYEPFSGNSCVRLATISLNNYGTTTQDSTSSQLKIRKDITLGGGRIEYIDVYWGGGAIGTHTSKLYLEIQDNSGNSLYTQLLIDFSDSLVADGWKRYTIGYNLPSSGTYRIIIYYSGDLSGADFGYDSTINNTTDYYWDSETSSWASFSNDWSLYVELRETTSGYVEQDIAVNVPVDEIGDFYFYQKYDAEYSLPTANSKFKITVTYDDATTTVIDNQSAASTWTRFNILPYLTSGKTVDKVKIEDISTENNAPTIIDAVHLYARGKFHFDDIGRLETTGGSVSIYGQPIEVHGSIGRIHMEQFMLEQ